MTCLHECLSADYRVSKLTEGIGEISRPPEKRVTAGSECPLLTGSGRWLAAYVPPHALNVALIGEDE